MEASDPSFTSWIELFDAYQRYRQGDLAEAGAAWKQLGQSPASDPMLKGFAWLAVAQVAGEKLLDTKDIPEQATGSAREPLEAVAQAWDEFHSIGNSGGMSQAHMLAAQVNYIIGRVEQARKELQAANTLFWNLNEKKGWVDVNLVGALGESRAGDKTIAENAVLAVEEDLDDRRIPHQQVKALVEFSHLLPSLLGLPDTRAIELKLADAREFHRWASDTGDPLLKLISLRTLSHLLREGSYGSAASFYDAVQQDLATRYRSTTPLSMRLQRAALLDYDFLRETKLLEQGELQTVTFDFPQWVDIFLAAQRGIRSEGLKQLPGVDMTQAEQAFDGFSEVLKKLAGMADDGRREFRDRLAAGDRPGAADGLAKLFRAFELIREFGILEQV